MKSHLNGPYEACTNHLLTVKDYKIIKIEHCMPKKGKTPEKMLKYQLL